MARRQRKLVLARKASTCFTSGSSAPLRETGHEETLFLRDFHLVLRIERWHPDTRPQPPFVWAIRLPRRR